jgi:hypothetical protein
MRDYIINPGQPHVLSLSEFLRPGHIISHFVHPSLAQSTFKRVTPVGSGREFGPFRIHLGRYALDPADNARRIESYSIPVVATFEGEKVGAGTATSLWVHPAFRRRDLAIEMIVDRMRYTGIEDWLRFHHAREAAGLKMRYTAEGAETMKAVHAVMIERGLLIEGLTL